MVDELLETEDLDEGVGDEEHLGDEGPEPIDEALE